MKRPKFVPESIKDEDVSQFVAAAACAKREGKKDFIFAGKKYKVTMKAKTEDKLDPVNKAAAAKKFKNRKDKDIDNDGDVDSSDEYLHKRRKAIGKAMKKESFSRVDAIVERVSGASEDTRQTFIKEYNITEESKYSEIVKSWKVFSR